MTNAEPVIINLCPTGMVPTKEMTPHVPITCDEILADVAKCAALGVSMVHVHARLDDGHPTHKAEAFAPIIEGIREIDPELVVCVTTSGRYATELSQRAEVLELDGAAKPDMASLTLGSNNFIKQASGNVPDVIIGLAERMRDRGIKPELEAFEPGMAAFGVHLAQRGIIAEPGYINFLLGNLGSSPLSPLLLGTLVSLIPDVWTWGVAGLGHFQLDANLMSVASGGAVRVGLEDNIWWDRERTTLATNPMLVERMVDAAALAGRAVATPAQVRAKLGLS